jgi:UDP-N-acetylglucosamine--N-acetylmuramyl-(pentapeptide) pyrophosphoryl-undecaprenol N-acetylglucosamine transferase
LDHGISVRVVISEKEVDSRLVQTYPEIPYQRAKGAPFSWRPARLAVFIFKGLYGFVEALRQLRSRPPSVVLAFGGFLSVSFVLAAWILRIPVVLHEANRKVGRSIRFLAGVADLVFLPEGVALPGIEARRVRRVGMPVRKEVRHIKKDEIRQQLNIPLHAKVLTVVGGSQGAEVLNKWVERHRRSLAADGIWIFLVAGPGKQLLPELETLESDMGQTVEVRAFSFHNALHELFSASDVVISRAGAGTIAELVECMTPGILVPYPYAADQHQLANARDLERRGACILLDQTQMNTLYREVLDLIYNDWLLGRMRTNLKRLNHGDPAEIICSSIIKRFNDDAGEQQPPVETGNAEVAAHGH